VVVDAADTVNGIDLGRNVARGHQRRGALSPFLLWLGATSACLGGQLATYSLSVTPPAFGLEALGGREDFRAWQQDSLHVSFARGDATFAGTLYRPAGAGPFPAVLVFHAADQPTRKYRGYQEVALALTHAGIAVLTFDRRGSGESTGDGGSASFADLARDGLAGVALLKSRSDIDNRRIGVYGISQGGWLSLLAAAMSRDIRFVAAVSASGVTPARQMAYAARHAMESQHVAPESIAKALEVRAVVDDFYRGTVDAHVAEQAIAPLRSEPWYPYMYLPNRGQLPSNPTSSKWAREMDFDPIPVIRAVRVPTLLVYADSDAWVPVNQSIRYMRDAAISSPKVTIETIPGTQHEMERTSGPKEGTMLSSVFLRELAAWLSNASDRKG
jgi:dienelactone hydrolase